jgi:hypothetical protein
MWLVPGLAGLLGYNPFRGVPFWVVLVISGGMILYGGILILVGILLRLRRKVYYFTAVILMGMSILLPVFDDFGMADLIVAVPAICTMILLLFNKKVLSDTTSMKTGL